MTEKNKVLNEMNLFHGTSGDSIEKIYTAGFNRSYCGVNGVAFGQGVYFAVNSSLSDQYSMQGISIIIVNLTFSLYISVLKKNFFRLFSSHSYRKENVSS